MRRCYREVSLIWRSPATNERCDPMTTRVPPTDGDAALPADLVVQRAAAHLGGLLKARLAAGLHVVSTPIGNLGDITLRAIATLARADVIYCEDTRHSRKLTDHFAIDRPLRPYHEHNAERERPAILDKLAAGGRIALISDAGTPLVSDPGYKLVREAVALGHTVTAVPGASAVLAGLAASGLPTDAFLFAGFLPPKAGARRRRLEALSKVEATLVLFEAPGRLAEALGDMAAVMGSRQGAVARELTKLHEEMVRGPLPELAASEREWIGEAVVLVAPAEAAAEATDAEITAALEAALVSSSVKDAARAVSERLGVAKGRVYDLALKLKAGGA